jgi:hypothetical protein
MTTNKNFNFNDQRLGRRTSGREYSFALKLVGHLIKQEATLAVVLAILLALMELCSLGDLATSIWNLLLPLLLKVMIASGILLAGIAFIESLNTD